MSDKRDMGSAIALYIFIAIVAATSVAIMAPDYLNLPEVSFWRRILFFILSVPACTIGLLLGRVIRDAIVPDFVVAESTGGLIKARLFWAFGPQSIGLGIGLALAGYVIQSLPAPLIPIDESKIVGVYQGQNGMAVIWHDRDGKGYCAKLGNNVACSDEGPDESNTIEFESDINGKSAKNEMELEFEEKGSTINFTVDGHEVYSWSQALQNRVMILNFQQGLFCGARDAQSESPQICVTDSNTQNEMWFPGRCASGACPPLGTPIIYGYDRYEVFDPETTSFLTKEILTSFEAAPQLDSIYPTMRPIPPSAAPTDEAFPAWPENYDTGTSQEPTEDGGVDPSTISEETIRGVGKIFMRNTQTHQ